VPQLIAISVFIAVTACIFTLLSLPRGQVRQRLNAFKELAIVEEDPNFEPKLGFMERLGRPIGKAALRAAAQVLPSSVAVKLKWRLTLAGDPVSLTGLVAIWVAAGILLPGVYFLLVSGGGTNVDGMSILLMIMLTGTGAYLPHVWLKAKARQRQNQILKSLPDAIDLLTTSVEAGLGIDAGLAQVAEKVRGPIAVEIRRVLRDMAMGSSRRDALNGFAERTELQDVQQFVNAIIQAEQMGVSLGHVIRVQADQMRVKRRQRAEALAYKAPVKMVFPLVFFIFPAIFVIVLGPAMIQIMDSIVE